MSNQPSVFQAPGASSFWQARMGLPWLAAVDVGRWADACLAEAGTAVLNDGRRRGGMKADGLHALKVSNGIRF